MSSVCLCAGHTFSIRPVTLPEPSVPVWTELKGHPEVRAEVLFRSFLNMRTALGMHMAF